MSYNQTIFNTPTIYIDIQDDFDRTLDVLIIIGQINKITKLEEERRMKKELERKVSLIGIELDKLGDRLEERMDLRDSVLDMYVNTKKNLLLRNKKGKFTSSHKIVKNETKWLLDWQEYKPVVGAYKKMTPDQQDRFIVSYNKFLKYQMVSIELNNQLERYGSKYLQNMEDKTKARMALTKAEDELAKAKTQLKKLGFVAIIKMMNDIEKKARRYKL